MATYGYPGAVYPAPPYDAPLYSAPSPAYGAPTYVDQGFPSPVYASPVAMDPYCGGTFAAPAYQPMPAYSPPPYQPPKPTNEPKEKRQKAPYTEVFNRWTVVAKSRDKETAARANQVLASHFRGVTTSDPKTLLKDASCFLGGMSGSSRHDPRFEGRHRIKSRYCDPDRTELPVEQPPVQALAPALPAPAQPTIYDSTQYYNTPTFYPAAQPAEYTSAPFYPPSQQYNSAPLYAPGQPAEYGTTPFYPPAQQSAPQYYSGQQFFQPAPTF